MTDTRLFLITGKGGVGKTTLAAALGLLFSSRGERTLLVETANDGSLAHCFAHPPFGSQPQAVQDSLWGVSVDSRALLEHYVTRMLRLPWLAQRLLASSAFQALSAAAPGVSEFLLLERIGMWVDAGFWHRRQRYQRVIVDGPATGHMLHLLRAPRKLLNLLPDGPLQRTVLEIEALLTDPAKTRVLMVAIAEELSVQETVEAYEILERELLLPVAPPIMNRVPPRYFTDEEQRRIRNQTNGGPLYEAARFVIERRALAERLIARLSHQLSKPYLLIPELPRPPRDRRSLERLGRVLRQLVEGRAGQAQRASLHASDR